MKGSGAEREGRVPCSGSGSLAGHGGQHTSHTPFHTWFRVFPLRDILAAFLPSRPLISCFV